LNQYIPPTFFIIGERKCGTSSLYRYLVQHPSVLPCSLKEPNFFGKGAKYVAQHIEEYWQLFPLKNDTTARTFSWPELNEQGILFHEDITILRNPNQAYITGEASANTFYEVDPSLVLQFLPKIKLIALLRNPIERAFSHYRMYQRFQEEGRDLGFIVRDFETEVREEMVLIQKGLHGEYLSPSIYIYQLEKWVSTFGREQIRIYFTEDLKEEPTAKVILEDLQDFLEVPHYEYGDFLSQHFNKAPEASIPKALKRELTLFFEPYNERLFEFLGILPRW